MSQTLPQAVGPTPELPQSLEQRPGELIEHVYPQPGHPSITDEASHQGFTDYLQERARGKIDRFIPGGWEIVEVPELITRKRFSHWTPGEWNWRRAAAVTLGVNLAVNAAIGEPNVVAAGKDVVEEVQQLKDTVEDWLHWDGEKVTYTTRRGTREVTEQQPNPDYRGEHGNGGPDVYETGETEPRQSVVDNLLNELQREMADGFRVKTISLFGTASDELRDPASIGRPDQTNADYAAERANKLADALRAGAAERGMGELPIEVRAEESILSPDNITRLNDTVAQFGYGSVSNLISTYNRDPESMPPSVKAFLDVEFGAKRGVNIALSFEDTRPETIDVITTVPTRERVKHTETITDDGEPRDEDHDYEFIPIPITWPPRRLPTPEFVDEPDIRIRKHLRRTGSILRDNVWVELYPEALQEGNTLDRDAWAMTRKYQALIREDRVHGVFRFGYKDAGGKDQSLRVMFVDHMPTPDTLMAVAEFAQDFSQMSGGKDTEQLGMISIFPSENAGGHDPKKIGLGIDEQMRESVQGVAMPAMGLVELHMPTNPTEDELHGYNGMRWVLAHEVAGHFTDVKSGPTRLLPTVGRNEYVTRNPWEDVGSRFFTGALARGISRLRWITRRNVQDMDGETHHAVEEVPSGDSRLQEAVAIQKKGSPTRYGETHQAEMYAETAAQVTTGILVPGTEYAQPLGTAQGNYARGYSVDPVLRDMFINHIARDPSQPRRAWSMSITTPQNWSHTFEAIKQDQAVNDPELRAIFEAARTTPLPPRQSLIRILTQVVGSDNR